MNFLNLIKDGDGINRGTGGGSSGSAHFSVAGNRGGASGIGGIGSSYSGGSAGGAVHIRVGTNTLTVAGSAEENCGDSGINLYRQREDVQETNSGIRGGGLLVVYAYDIEGNGNWESLGESNCIFSSLLNLWHLAQSCGGGSINVFAKNNISVKSEKFDVTGGTAEETWCRGGNGSISVGTIGLGRFMSSL